MAEQPRKSWSSRLLPERRGRVLYGKAAVGFREADKNRIERGGLLLVIEPVEA